MRRTRVFDSIDNEPEISVRGMGFNYPPAVDRINKIFLQISERLPDVSFSLLMRKDDLTSLGKQLTSYYEMLCESPLPDRLAALTQQFAGQLAEPDHKTVLASKSDSETSPG